MGNKEKKKYNIPEPKEQLVSTIQGLSKYRIGDLNVDFHDILKLKPIFAFDYVSLNNEELCFNCGDLETKDYIGLIEGLKKVSALTYSELDKQKAFRFHVVNFDDKRVSITRDQFRSLLTTRPELLPDDQLPTLYQFDLQYIREARVCGFIFRGVFYLIWYDRNHIIYPQKK
ncbi:MAG: hypothetical protein JNL02_11585 [Saprospiraceae bacterium]|nr:hypothetical protein [Saprospiraceae bacterium]